ncbi:UNVERIFIED_CONTAM: hypothetical protein PYX00_008753 [Menopon gallinae]|uniref:Arrestin C-terminal-like domain-containing protein n=1 Tax=Menopon gallinae TaxID=328185 RepID=A0AAW2HPQ9_9NEOP
MVTVNVVFGNPNKFYFEGEKLLVKLEVSVDNPVNIHTILAIFVGECNCSGDSDFERKTRVKERNENEIYFDDILPVYVASGENCCFSKGVHQYPIEYQLPCSLPSSLESPQGHVRYSLKVVTDVGGTLLKSCHYFTVVAKINLNNDAAANLPIVLWKHESQCIFACVCPRNGLVRAFVHISRKSFVPGERLTINAEVWNFSSLPVNWVKAAVVQILKYNCTKAAKRKRVVAEVTRGCILPRDNQVWRSESLCIPAIPPSSCSVKRMITVKYKLYFMIKTSWQEKAICLKENVTIGTVPLMGCKQSEERGQGEGKATLNNSSYHYSDLEPCIFGPHSVIEEDETSSFSPLYPVYTEPYN